MLNKPYSNVTIELTENYKINELKEILSKHGETKISLIVKINNKKPIILFKKSKI